MADHTFETPVQVRFRDLDALGHVNNAVYATYLEAARVRYFREEYGLGFRDLGFVVARLELDYRAPITDTDEVVVSIGVADVGETSFTLAYEIRDDDTVAATAETVIVCLDDGGSPSPIPEEWRSKLET